MSDPKSLDGILVQWGDRLFYPGVRSKQPAAEPRLRGGSIAERAANIRARIAATVVQRVPQVMVKISGGGRGMKAIAAHLRYISKNGRLAIEDERGERLEGTEAVQELRDDWKFGGSLIGDDSPRREAFNIVLSMPRGTDPSRLHQAARAFAKAEFADHKYVMVLHEHQQNPHVHLSVRAESKEGRRLNPRKADLHRWRETFATALRDRGIEAEATRQATRGRDRNHEPLWRLKARQDGRLRTVRPGFKATALALATRTQAVEAWMHIGEALAMSGDADDRTVANAIATFMKEMPTSQSAASPKVAPDVAPQLRPIDIGPQR